MFVVENVDMHYLSQKRDQSPNNCETKLFLHLDCLNANLGLKADYFFRFWIWGEMPYFDKSTNYLILNKYTWRLDIECAPILYGNFPSHTWVVPIAGTIENNISQIRHDLPELSFEYLLVLLITYWVSWLSEDWIPPFRDRWTQNIDIPRTGVWRQESWVLPRTRSHWHYASCWPLTPSFFQI